MADADPDPGNRLLLDDRPSIHADPKFVDPENDDYTLAPDSPAFDLGFEQIDTSKIGIRAPG